MPNNPKNFNVDNVRVVKIMGGSLSGSRVVQGMVFGREPETQVKKVKKGKVAVFTCALDIAQTETKGTVLLKSADEMLNFTSGEEAHLEKVRSMPLSTFNYSGSYSLPRSLRRSLILGSRSSLLVPRLAS